MTRAARLLALAAIACAASLAFAQVARAQGGLPLGPLPTLPWTPPPTQSGATKSGAGASQPQAEATLSDDKSAVDAGSKWLERVDHGDAGELWDEAAKPLKSVVPRANWVTGLRDLRKPYGKLESRKAVRFARAHELPNAPKGDYAIIEYESQFANGRKAVEHVVWMLEPDGVWRVSGYYLR